jgi:hypothetical protein
MRRILAWLAAALGLVWLAISVWGDIAKGSSAVISFVIAAICIVVLAALFGTNVIRVSETRHIPFISPGPRLSNLIKAGLCLIVGVLWAYFGAVLEKNTTSWWAVGAVMGPPIVLAGLVGWFVFKSSGPGNRA